jgi:hypothetical protein
MLVPDLLRQRASHIHPNPAGRPIYRDVNIVP